MVVFFLSVALTNLALGYALALYLHPHTDSGELPIPNLQPDAQALPVRDSQSSKHSSSTTEVDLPEQPAPALTIATEAVAAVHQNNSIDGLATQNNNAAEIAAPSEPIEAAADEADSSIESDEMNCGFAQFASHLQAYRAKLADILQRIQQCAQQPDAGQVQGCLRDLRAMNYDYFEHQLEISEQLAKSANVEDADARTRISAAVAAQSAQISDVDCALVELDPSADALHCAQKLLDETAKLLHAGETFADVLRTAERASV